jgi:hypothetical protein
VIETRVQGLAVKRRRGCKACEIKVWTIELVVGRTFDFRLKLGPQGLEVARIDEPGQ